VALLTVRLYGDPVLRQVAAPVTEVTPEIKRIIADMTETM
jgi:peptide deformylase